jgi:hypothetical protein
MIHSIFASMDSHFDSSPGLDPGNCCLVLNAQSDVKGQRAPQASLKAGQGLEGAEWIKEAGSVLGKGLFPLLVSVGSNFSHAGSQFLSGSGQVVGLT